MMLVVYAVLVMGVLGAVFGAVLGFAAKVFHVEVDPREEAIAGCLPGANCGGCGFPGCGGYAAAVVKGEAPVNACAAGGAAVAAQIAEIVKGEIIGDAARSVTGVAGIKEASADQLSFVGSRKYADLLGDAKAGIVLICADLCKIEKPESTLIVCKNF